VSGGYEKGSEFGTYSCIRKNFLPGDDNRPGSGFSIENDLINIDAACNGLPSASLPSITSYLSQGLLEVTDTGPAQSYTEPLSEADPDCQTRSRFVM